MWFKVNVCSICKYIVFFPLLWSIYGYNECNTRTVRYWEPLLVSLLDTIFVERSLYEYVFSDFAAQGSSRLRIIGDFLEWHLVYTKNY